MSEDTNRRAVWGTQDWQKKNLPIGTVTVIHQTNSACQSINPCPEVCCTVCAQHPMTAATDAKLVLAFQSQWRSKILAVLVQTD